ncbi:MAG: hypothetical protein JO333_12050 [Verrucomicrobia bacterium]|nr:hypothetical protein [Verrucomicrobiota bacterium]
MNAVIFYERQRRFLFVIHISKFCVSFRIVALLIVNSRIAAKRRDSKSD